jgi:hypothetical protein
MTLEAALLAFRRADFSAAESLLAGRIEQLRQASETEARAEAAYWMARVRLALKRAGAVTEYEQELRSFGGLPRAACWFVDLLWRSGKPDRAEQVWKALRGSPRISLCDEAALIEARILLWRGDLGRAEHVLIEAAPRDSVVQVERLLFLAWVHAARKEHDLTASFLRAVQPGCFPEKALRQWNRLLPLNPETAKPPAGVSPVPWLLHQASLAVGRDDLAEALLWTQRALAEDPELVQVGERGRLIRAALPNLKHLARAKALADVAQFAPEVPALPPPVLIGALDLIEQEREGRALLDAAQRGDLVDARKLLGNLAERQNLPGKLAHHLALIYLRAAQHWDEADKPHLAEPYWRLCWPCWLRWAAVEAQPEDRTRVFDWLLALHRRRLKELLARERMEPARDLWRIIMDLPEQVQGNPKLAQELAERLSRFRDQLATEYRVQTREATCYGSITDGWNADYERGLSGLTRLLSLDRENLLLLTALMEICAEWFLDCYNNEALEELSQGVDRFTPFALQLARLLDRSEKPELSARAALAEFTKFRGFVAADPARKAALYREALRFHPGSDNVRQLLAEAEAEENP